MAVVGGVGAVLCVAAVVGAYLMLTDGSDRDTLHDTTTAAPPTTTLSPGVSLIAQASVPQVHVYRNPSERTPSKTLANPWLLNGEADKPIPQVFLVQRQRPDGWVEVLLPERPNGSTGWVRADDLTLTQSPYRIKVSLSDHEITVYEGTSRLYQGSVAVGTPSTPTPTGTYYIRVLLQTLDPDSVYGPFAYGLSAHSDVLTEFNGGDAEVGIHGNNDASVLGRSVTSGCIRMDNVQITELTRILPLGTPVEITA